MQALFSRARTASTPSKSKHIKNQNDKDHPPLPPLSTGATRAHTVGDREMGYAGYGYGAGYNAEGNYPSGGGAARPRSSSLNLASGQGGGGQGQGHQEVGFLPTILPADPHVPWAGSAAAPAPPTPSSPGGFLPPPPLGLSSSTSGTTGPRQSYGLLSAARDTVLGLPDVGRLVTVLCAQLEATGVATPFVFSSLALDVRKAGVVRLVNAFLKTCEGTNPNPPIRVPLRDVSALRALACRALRGRKGGEGVVEYGVGCYSAHLFKCGRRDGSLYCVQCVGHLCHSIDALDTLSPCRERGRCQSLAPPALALDQAPAVAAYLTSISQWRARSHLLPLASVGGHPGLAEDDVTASRSPHGMWGSTNYSAETPARTLALFPQKGLGVLPGRPFRISIVGSSTVPDARTPRPIPALAPHVTDISLAP
ncbi:hypothetical protein R3P38DRAFT_3445146 [Favolaschia claudopus]|uniref:Uncharacterized protein n=1 Tax=Favolaschia claudopus TaxID=2862362 RepID=A0AAV9ZPT4_9AGAR